MTWKTYETVLLALVLWREAKNQKHEGMRAVAHAIRNRVKASKSSLIEDYAAVIAKKWQFTSMTGIAFDASNKVKSADPMLIQWPILQNAKEAAIFNDALTIAEAVHDGTDADDPTHGATYYANLHVCHPDWADKFKKTAEIGDHTFFVEG